MYEIKKFPEDFIVGEMPDIKLVPQGPYLICLLKKRNYTTLRAVEQIAASLNIPIDRIGYAGSKDKNAVAFQFISLRAVPRQRADLQNLKDISLSFQGYSESPLFLGSLVGNSFEIRIRKLSAKQMSDLLAKSGRVQSVPNYFGEQRFSKGNQMIGKLLVKKDFRQAAASIRKRHPEYRREGSPVTYLQYIPKKLLSLYIHSYQSLLWNRFRKMQQSAETIPMIGFGTDEQLLRPYESILEQEGVSPRDFIIKELPLQSAEGVMRNANAIITDLKVVKESDDIAMVTFSLGKGSYATVAIHYLLDDLEHSLKDLI